MDCTAFEKTSYWQRNHHRHNPVKCFIFTLRLKQSLELSLRLLRFQSRKFRTLFEQCDWVVWQRGQISVLVRRKPRGGSLGISGWGAPWAWNPGTFSDQKYVLFQLSISDLHGPGQLHKTSKDECKFSVTISAFPRIFLSTILRLKAVYWGKICRILVYDECDIWRHNKATNICCSNDTFQIIFHSHR